MRFIPNKVVGAAVSTSVALALVASVMAGGAVVAPQAAQAASSSGAVPSLQKLVPAAIRKAGVIKAASNLEFPPYTFKTASGAAAGIEPQLMTEIGKLLGLKVTFTQVQFPALLPALQNGRFMVGLDQLGDTKVRENTANFVDYLKGSDTLLVRSGNPDHVTVKSLCGDTVAVTTGTVEVTSLAAASTKCQKEGKPAIDSRIFQDSSAQILAVTDGRAEATPIEIAVAAYVAKHSHGKTETLASPLSIVSSYTVAIGVGKSTGLTEAIKASVAYMMKDGAYKKLLAKWDDTADAISSVALNDPNRAVQK